MCMRQRGLLWPSWSENFYAMPQRNAGQTAIDALPLLQLAERAGKRETWGGCASEGSKANALRDRLHGFEPLHFRRGCGSAQRSPTVTRTLA
jgi:hypothetical protein